jgi:fimbrial chaperone protein
MMMRSWISGLLTATSLVAAPVVASASTLQVTPVTIEVPAPGAVSSVTLANPGTDLVNAQVRVFRWLQVDGKEELVETHDVVASPPAVRLQPGKKSVIRVVRVNKAPTTAEETYRLIVDEVPKPPKAGEAGVGFSVRYSIPVFFTTPGATANLSWEAVISGGVLVLKASNSGGHHVRLAALSIANDKSKTIHVSDGLAGYVLGQSSHLWIVKAKSMRVGSTIRITAQGDDGPIEATARVVAAN